MAQPEDHGGKAIFLRGGGATGALIADFDWSATDLGPLDTWPGSLKIAVGIVLRSPAAMALLWGPSGVMIYNDAYAVLAGPRHPQLLGAKVREAWPEIADFDDRVIRAVLGGQALKFRDQPLTISRRRGKPEQSWFDLDYSPVLDESGRPTGVLALVVETTQRVLAEARAAAHNERQIRMYEQGPGFICILKGPEHIFEFVNETYKRLFGREPVGKSVREVFKDLPDQSFIEVFDGIYASGDRYVARAMPLQIPIGPDGRIHELFLDFILEPITDDDGSVTGIFVEGFDVTEQMRAQAAVRESERRLSAAITIARLGAFTWDRSTREAHLDPRAREIFGFGPDEVVTMNDMIRRIEPQDRERVSKEVAAAEARGELHRTIEYRVRRPDGSIRNVVSVSNTLNGPTGERTRAIGVFDDVTERRAAEKRQQMLINELNHRVKNTLATVQSIAAQTLRTAADLPSSRESFEARLVALAGAHDLLTAQNWQGARLSDVAASALAPFETVQRPQISRSGPLAWLGAPQALALTLALHELAANAVKYGALSTPAGRVAIRWSFVGAELTLAWTETGGPPVTAPGKLGFGARLLMRSLAHQLNGHVALDFAPDGLRCEIRCRIERGGAAAAQALAM